MIKTICVYCSSSDKVRPIYFEAAHAMGRTLAQHGLRMVYGAGKTGLMGAVADAALQAGGEVVGVIPAFFNTPALVHQGLSTLEVVETMHERKARLVELADAFVALPGGFGTFEEFFEIVTWSQIGLHAKPIGLLNADGYYDPLLKMVEHAYAEGMIYAEHRQLFVHARLSEELLDALKNHQRPVGLERWTQRTDD